MRHLHCCQNVPLETELWLGCMNEDKTELVNVELQIRTVSFRGQVIIHLEFLGYKSEWFSPNARKRVGSAI